MQLSHTRRVVSALFDDPNLVSAVGLVPVMKLAEEAGLCALAQKRLTVPTDKGANAGLKVVSLVGGMVAGADCLDDMALLRHGGMRKLFSSCYAPSTLGSFLRWFTFGHVRQLDAVATRFLSGLTENSAIVAGVDDLAMSRGLRTPDRRESTLFARDGTPVSIDTSLSICGIPLARRSTSLTLPTTPVWSRRTRPLARRPGHDGYEKPTAATVIH